MGLRECVRECVRERFADDFGLVLLVSSVRTIAKAFNTLDRLESTLKKANGMPKANRSNGHGNGQANGTAKKSNWVGRR